VSDRRTPDATIISALLTLARDIKSGDGCANACLLEAAQRLEELVEERRWVPVGERLPTDGQLLDVAGLWGDSVGWYENCEFHSVEDNFESDVTHWRKRTPGPEGDGNG
jgi:hypothetical protein